MTQRPCDYVTQQKREAIYRPFLQVTLSLHKKCIIKAFLCELFDSWSNKYKNNLPRIPIAKTKYFDLFNFQETFVEKYLLL